MLDRMWQKILSWALWSGFPVAVIAAETPSEEKPYYQLDWAFGLSGNEIVWTMGALATAFKIYEFVEGRMKKGQKKRFRIKKRDSK